LLTRPWITYLIYTDLVDGKRSDRNGSLLLSTIHRAYYYFYSLIDLSAATAEDK